MDCRFWIADCGFESSILDTGYWMLDNDLLLLLTVFLDSGSILALFNDTLPGDYSFLIPKVIQGKNFLEWKIVAKSLLLMFLNTIRASESLPI